MNSRDTYALALPILALAACGGGGSTDIEATMSFADRTDAEISRLISAAGGTDMFSAEGQIDQFGDTFEADPCPVITIDGNTATVTGGCTRIDGTEIQGSATVTNPFNWDQLDYNYGDDITYEAQQLSFIYSGVTQTYDGFIRRSGDFTTWDADITTTSFGVTLRSDLYYHCSNPSHPSCSLSGSGLELIGVGGAQVSGKVKVDTSTNTQVSDFTLKGTDTLTVHVANNCIGWAIEGTDRGMVCP